MKNYINDLIKFVIETDYEDLSAEIISYSKKHILDTIGIISAGSSAEGIKETLDIMKEWGGKPESTVPIYGDKLPAPSASFVIGPMARAWDFGGVHPDANEHTTEYVLPAALPIAEAFNLSGKELILAVALGNEIISRIGASVHTITGVSMAKTHSIFRIWGPVVAVGKLLNLDEEQLQDAMGLAYTQGGGDNQMFVDGVLKIRIQHGMVTDTAIKSVFLAKKGITGTKKFLEGEKGFYNAFFPDYNEDWLTKGLKDKQFIAPRTIIKGYPTCTYTHSSIETALKCVIENDINPNNIKKIKVGVNTPTYQLVAIPKETRYNPKTPADAQFSIPYCVSCAVVNRKVFIDDFLDSAIKRDDILDMASKIKVDIDEEIEKTDPVGFAGAKVTITTIDNKKYKKRIDYVKGTPQNPMSFNDVSQKYDRCMKYISGSITKKSSKIVKEKIRQLENISDVSDILNNLYQK